MIQPATTPRPRPAILAAALVLDAALLLASLFLSSHVAIDVIVLAAFLACLAGIEMSHVRLPLPRVLLPTALIILGVARLAQHPLVHHRVAIAAIDVVALSVALMLLAMLATRALNRLGTPHPLSLRPPPGGDKP